MKPIISTISSTWATSKGGGGRKKEKNMLVELAMSPQSPAIGAWDWASLGGGGRKKEKKGCPIPEKPRPSPPEKPRPRPQLLQIENSLRLEVLETRSPS